MLWWSTEKKATSLFGLELKLNPVLRQPLLSDRRAADLKVNREFLNSLEDGDWDEISYSKLFILTVIAEELGVPLFFVQSGGLWATFRSEKRTKRLLIGRNKKGNPIGVDIKCAEPFFAAFDLAFDAKKAFDREKILKLMEEENLILIGGSKVNEATRVALEVFQKTSGINIRFWWPDFDPQSHVEGRSTDGRKHLHIGPKKLVEGAKGQAPFFGLVAACRDPLNKKRDVSTVVVAGCSAHATRLISEEIQKPSFGRQYHSRWAEQTAGQPIFFVFSMKDGKADWELISRTRPKRKTGRPPRGR